VVLSCTSFRVDILVLCSIVLLLFFFFLSGSFLPHQVGVHYELSEEEKFYRNALTRMPDGPAALEEAYNAVEDIVNEVEQYVKVRATLLKGNKKIYDGVIH